MPIFMIDFAGFGCRMGIRRKPQPPQEKASLRLDRWAPDVPSTININLALDWSHVPLEAEPPCFPGRIPLLRGLVRSTVADGNSSGGCWVLFQTFGNE